MPTIPMLPTIAFRYDIVRHKLELFVIQVPEEEVTRQLVILEHEHTRPVLTLDTNTPVKKIFWRMVQAVMEALHITSEDKERMFGRPRNQSEV